MQKEGFLAFWGFQTVSVSKTDTVLRQRKIESRTF
jgi:hypothetical protein